MTENCDDFNNLDGDGCTSNCIIEEGYYCSGGTSNTSDVCLLKPFPKLLSITQENLVIV